MADVIAAGGKTNCNNKISKADKLGPISDGYFFISAAGLWTRDEQVGM
jgi:hypothetical protein